MLPPPSPPKKSKKKLWWILGILFFIFIILPGSTLVVLAYNPALSAETADHVLRPLLGDSATIAIEGVVLGIEDKINHARYSQPPVADYQPAISLVPVTPFLPATATPNAATDPLPTETPSPLVLPTITPTYDADSLLPDEDTWQSIPKTNLYTTFVRTDSSRTYAVVNLVYMPMSQLNIMAVAGTEHPGGELGLPGPGKIPDDIQASGSLVAAFNGGFQEKDGHYGMVVGSTTYVPLRKGLATLFIYNNGHANMAAYDGKPLDPTVTAARQNGLFLVQNGQDTKYTAAGTEIWAGTASGDFITWRSGIGVTASGDLIYAVGPSLTPQALADALRIAGCVNAMQLDINDFWVRFMVYQADGKGGYTYNSLIPALANGGKQYLNSYQKDFFYVYKK